ncbi:MAG: 4-(cytidine 5'-diphospho)-2-C-methyl-D-erythritol kinase [Thermodesulfobacteriota bacterium]|nr:4-(cytidine 5'-diphospho)-2-C-methyl-D-erythritol kinase [Thermodesulfobacteriota bacterium]
MVEKLHLESPAKVNLRLEILMKREDGYHEVKTILQKISLHDTLHVSLKRERGIRITTDHPDLPIGKRNLVYQAAQSILKRSDYREGIDIKIEKRIPLGAGLGGGSSNAATTLKALNQLLKMNLMKKELMEMGKEIGADVPFFLFEGAAIGSGIGERLRKITLPSFWYILIYPDFEVSTRWAYQNSILTKVKYHFNLHKLLKTSEGIVRLLWNDLEGVVSVEYSEIGTMKRMLTSAGAMGAMMTGSGPTVFGLFSEEEKASEAYRKVKNRVKERGWTVIKARSIP